MIALCLAFSETLGKSAQTAALSYNVEASNLWAFFQAKTIRQTVIQAATEMLKIDLPATPAATGADQGRARQTHRSWEKIAARYDTELMDPPVRKDVNLNPPYGEGRRELMARAIAAEAKRDTALERYHHYEVASAAFQIGIVLASATVITGMVLLTLSRRRARADRHGVHGDRLLRPACRAFVLNSRVAARRPPFTCSVWPVMKAASSLVRNETVPTRSAGTCHARDRLPRRRRGERFLHVGLARTRPARHRAGRARQRRRDGVDGDAMRPELGRQHVGQADHAALAGDVVRQSPTRR